MNVKRSGTEDINKKVDFKTADTEKEDRERERSRLKKLKDERLKRPCTYMVKI
jgi:hypothetical protein